jgi:sulfate transport system ATP-binding protein
MTAVSATDVVKRFGRFPALDHVTVEAKSGEFLALLGPSGSGKTTLLRLFAGLDFPDSGMITFDGEDVSARPVRERGVGFVFQNYALFKHMTVGENIAFGLKVKPWRQRPRRRVIADRVEELLDLVQLPGYGKRFPAQLSGGQRQRVALARALAVQPKLLLLDEPFGALDAKVRKDLRRWLREIHDETGITSIFVTHDQEEALEIADRVVVMSAGQVEQVDEPATIYNQPGSAFVADFLGDANRLSARIEGGRVRIGASAVANSAGDQPDGEAVAYVRSHEFAIAHDPEDGFAVRVDHVLDAGPALRIDATVLASGEPIEVRLRERHPVTTGAELRLRPTVVRAYPVRP